MSQGNKRDKRTKRSWNPHYATKLNNQPARTLKNKVRRLGNRVRMNPNDRVAFEALHRALLRK